MKEEHRGSTGKRSAGEEEHRGKEGKRFTGNKSGKWNPIFLIFTTCTIKYGLEIFVFIIICF